jgi:hypothetical protein
MAGRKQGRTDAYEVLKDVVAIIDTDVQKIRAMGDKDPEKPFEPKQAAALAGYLRELSKCTAQQPGWDAERLGKLSDGELQMLIKAAQAESKGRAGVS